MPLSWIVAINPLLLLRLTNLTSITRLILHCLQNGMQPSGSLTTEQVIDDAQFNRLKTQFSLDLYRFTKTMAKPLILEGGLKWQPFGFLTFAMLNF